MSYRKSEACLRDVIPNAASIRFYKETLINETDNYVYATSMYNGTDTFSTLRETAQDAIDCIRRTENVLSGKGEYERAWKLHAAGYIQMHLVRGRYRLWEVGLGDLPLSEEVVTGILCPYSMNI